MELQRAPRRRDELGHQPLCDRIRRCVFGKANSSSRCRDVTADCTRVDAERARRLRERALQHVAQNKRAEVRAAQRKPADEVAETRSEQPAALDRLCDRARDLAV
jgi:hypothetical protein